MSPTDPHLDPPSPARRPSSRFYAFTDNGDWMELTPQTREEPASGVWFFALDEEDDAEFFMRADEGQGILLGRVTIIAGAPVLQMPDAIVAEAEVI